MSKARPSDDVAKKKVVSTCKSNWEKHNQYTKRTLCAYVGKTGRERETRKRKQTGREEKGTQSQRQRKTEREREREIC